MSEILADVKVSNYNKYIKLEYIKLETGKLEIGNIKLEVLIM